jgi:hypothetical protein
MIASIRLTKKEFDDFKKKIVRAVNTANEYKELTGADFLATLDEQLNIAFGDNEFKRDAGRGDIRIVSENEE